LPDYLYRYRPYLIKKSDKWIHFNYTENFIKRFLRRNSHLYAAVESLMHSIPKNQLANERSKLRSNFYDYDKASLEQFVEILRRFREEGKKTKIAVVIIPVEEDLKRFAHEKDDLSPLY
jgi:Ser-tRNA(Ala) deacylase AlaX